MQTLHRFLTLGVLALAACTPAQTPGEKADINQLAEAYMDEYFRLNPVEASFVGENQYNDTLVNSLTAAFRTESRAMEDRWVARLQGLDTTGLPEQQRLTYELMRFNLQRNIAARPHEHLNYLAPMHQMGGAHTLFAQLGSGASAQPFNTVADYDAWLKRASYIPAYLDTAIANMRTGMAQGVTLPKVVVPRLIGQVKSLATAKPAESVFYKPIADLPARGFSAEDQTRLEESLYGLITDQLLPAYQRLLKFLEEEYLPKARTTETYADLPGGKEAYTYLASYHTTTSLTPQEIHEIGKREVARIRTEMDSIMRVANFKGDLKAFFNHLRTAPQIYPFKSEAEILEAYRAIGQRMAPKVAEQFPLQPKSKLEIREIESFREVGAAAHYYQGTPDGSRPGVFYVPILKPTEFASYDMEDLYLHEAVPGHHFQVMIALELEGMPRFRRFNSNTSYEEGWALYAESLGKDLGLFTDPYQYAGRLDGEMHRAIRLVVDAGLHSLGWTRQQAIDYSLENEGRSKEEITREIERYMVMPGQALAYKIGQLKISELRARAEKALGSKFNVGAFHARVLDSGSLPLAVLEQRIDSWIASQQ